MQSFTAWVRWIVGGIFTLIILPQVGKVLDHMAENYGWYDREALPNAINIFLSLAERTWLRVTALVLGGFVAGMLVDLFLRKLDGSRADTIKLFGAEMVKLGNYLDSLNPLCKKVRGSSHALPLLGNSGYGYPMSEYFDFTLLVHPRRYPII
jgi:hypothetical protein